MSKKKIENELLNHEYDGIQEFDNDLPPWWLNMFLLTIAFAVIYLGYYHVFHLGPDQNTSYQAEFDAAEKLKPKLPEGALPGGPAVLIAYKDQEHLEKGKSVFVTNCAPCHGQNGQGDVGPNLTDEYWIHGPKFVNMVTTIVKGVPDKGMITWGGVLPPEDIRLVASYIVTLTGSHPESPKAPQGDKYDTALVGQ